MSDRLISCAEDESRRGRGLFRTDQLTDARYCSGAQSSRTWVLCSERWVSVNSDLRMVFTEHGHSGSFAPSGCPTRVLGISIFVLHGMKHSSPGLRQCCSAAGCSPAAGRASPPPSAATSPPSSSPPASPGGWSSASSSRSSTPAPGWATPTPSTAMSSPRPAPGRSLCSPPSVLQWRDRQVLLRLRLSGWAVYKVMYKLSA